MAKRESFVFYRSFYNAIKKMPNEYQLEIYNAIFEYSLEGNENLEMSQVASAMFTLIKPNIDSAINRYDTKVENGKRGGRPKKETELKPNNNLTETELKPNANHNDNDNVNDNDDVNENDNVNDNMQKKADKKIHFAEFVTMTNDEYKKLEIAYGKEFIDQCITVLDNYKGANGKRYKSDYRAILNWVIDKVKTNYKTKPEGNVFFNILKEGGKFNE